MYTYYCAEDLSNCYHLSSEPTQSQGYVKYLSFLNDKLLSPVVRLFYSLIYTQCTYHYNLLKKRKLNKDQVLSECDQFFIVMSHRDIAKMLSISESSVANLIHEMTHLGLIERDGAVQKKAKYLINFPTLEMDGSMNFTETPEVDQKYIREQRSKREASVAGHPRLECGPLTPALLRSDYAYTAIPEPALTRSDLSPVEIIVLSCFEMSRRLSAKNGWIEDGGLLYIRRNLNKLAEELCLTPKRVKDTVERLVSKGYVFATLEDNGSARYYLVNLYSSRPCDQDFRSVILQNVSSLPSGTAKNTFITSKNEGASLQKNNSLLIARKIYLNKYLESFSLDDYERTDFDVLYKKAEEKADIQLSIDRKIALIQSGNLDLNGQTFDQLREELKVHVDYDQDVMKYVGEKPAQAVLTECVRILQSGSDSDLMLFVLGMNEKSFIELCSRFDLAQKRNAEKGTPIRCKGAYIRKLIQNIPEIETDLLFREEENAAKEAVYMDRLCDCQESSDVKEAKGRVESYDYDDISRDDALNTLEESVRKNDTEQLWAHSTLISNPEPSSRKSADLKKWASGLKKSGIGARLISGSQEGRILSSSLSKKKTYDDLIGELSSERVLIIDDLGMEKYDLLEKVLTNRLQDPDKYTLIATRLSPEELQLRYHSRTVSRIFGGIVTH